jgi:hypothetical protein
MLLLVMLQVIPLRHLVQQQQQHLRHVLLRAM